MSTARRKTVHSIVVPVHNNASDLRSCLASLKAQTYDRDLFEIIVVDNNSTDESAAVAESAGVRCLREERFQSSYAARNCGIRAAQGDFIVFLDSDCVAHPDWLRQIDARTHNAKVGCFAGEILSIQPTTTTEQFSEAIGLLRQRGPLSGWHFKPYAQTANATYRKAVFEKVGLFDPTIKSGGDAILAWRMLDQTDYQIEFVPEAIVYHHHRSTVPDLWSQFSRYGNGKIAWTLSQRDYVPPAVAKLESDLIAEFNRLVVKLEAVGADAQEIIFPILQSMTQVAHYSGYLRELLKLTTHDAPPDLWPKIAAEHSNSCDICGSCAFIPGPSKRMAGRQTPQCLECGSLERHRVLYKVLGTMDRKALAHWSCVSIGEPLLNHLRWFGKTSHINLDETVSESISTPCDLAVALNVLFRSKETSIPDLLVNLVSPLKDNGMLILVDEASHNITGSAVADYERQIAQRLPNVSVRSTWTLDQVTGSEHVVTCASQDPYRTSHVALNLSRESFPQYRRGL